MADVLVSGHGIPAGHEAAQPPGARMLPHYAVHATGGGLLLSPSGMHTHAPPGMRAMHMPGAPGRQQPPPPHGGVVYHAALPQQLMPVMSPAGAAATPAAVACAAAVAASIGTATRGAADVARSSAPVVDIHAQLAARRAAVAEAPTSVPALVNLASSLTKTGDARGALVVLEQALGLDGAAANAWYALGFARRELGDATGAVHAFRRACELAPCVARYASTLASCLYATGDMRGAVTAYEQSLVLEPQNADVLNNLGNAHRELGASSEAVTCYNRALQLAPQHPHAWNNLGNCMKDAGDLAAALTCYRTACTYMPAFAAARSNLASALKESGHTGEAIAQYHEALRADPHFADAWSNLGNTLKESGRLNDAIQCYTNAVSIRPSFADAHANLACALKDCGRVLEAAHVYQQALALRPTFADAHTNLIHCYLLVCDWREHSSGYDTLLRLLLPQIASILGRREVEAALRASGDARELEAWRLATGRALLPEGGSRSCAPTDPASTNTVLSLASEGAADAAGDAAELSDAEFGQRIHMSGWLPAVQPFHSLVYPMSLALMRLLAHCYAKRTAQAALSSGLPLRRGGAAVGGGSAGRRIRIGYVSSDFGNHPLSHLMQSVFRMHDRSRFEVICYALTPDDGSEWRQTIAKGADRLVDISMMPNRAAAQLIHDEAVDVLVNLNGYTKGARNEIFALQPAALNVSYLGFCGTLGAEYVQYMVADDVVVPSAHARHFTESVIRMPHSYFVNDHRQCAQDVLARTGAPRRSDLGLPQDAFIFANFNQLYKLDPTTFAVWCRILQRVPHSVLWLLRFPAAGEARIRAAADALGLPQHKLIFTDVAPKADHLRRCALADCVLDTHLCNAHTTGCDVLWAGVPLITLPGVKMASRVAASLLRAVDCDVCIASDWQHYEDMAVTLAQQPLVYRSLRSHVEAQRMTCPLFDTPRWVRNLETGFVRIMERHAAGLPPAPVDVHDAGSSSSSSSSMSDSPTAHVRVGCDSPVATAGCSTDAQLPLHVVALRKGAGAADASAPVRSDAVLPTTPDCLVDIASAEARIAAHLRQHPLPPTRMELPPPCFAVPPLALAPAGVQVSLSPTRLPSHTRPQSPLPRAQQVVAAVTPPLVRYMPVRAPLPGAADLQCINTARPLLPGSTALTSARVPPMTAAATAAAAAAAAAVATSGSGAQYLLPPAKRRHDVPLAAAAAAAVAPPQPQPAAFSHVLASAHSLPLPLMAATMLPTLGAPLTLSAQSPPFVVNAGAPWQAGSLPGMMHAWPMTLTPSYSVFAHPSFPLPFDATSNVGPAGLPSYSHVHLAPMLSHMGVPTFPPSPRLLEHGIDPRAAASYAALSPLAGAGLVPPLHPAGCHPATLVVASSSYAASSLSPLSPLTPPTGVAYSPVSGIVAASATGSVCYPAAAHHSIPHAAAASGSGVGSGMMGGSGGLLPYAAAFGMVPQPGAAHHFMPSASAPPMLLHATGSAPVVMSPLGVPYALAPGATSSGCGAVGPAALAHPSLTPLPDMYPITPH